MRWLLMHGAPVDNTLIGTFASAVNSPLYCALEFQQETAALLLIQRGATLRFLEPPFHNRGYDSDRDDRRSP